MVSNISLARNEDGDLVIVQTTVPTHVLIAAPEGFSLVQALEQDEIIAIGAMPIEFAIDFGELFDRWTGSPVVARLAPYPDDDRIRQVAEYQILDATYVDRGDDGFDLALSDSDSVIEVRLDADGFDVHGTGGPLDAGDARWELLMRYLGELGFAVEVDEAAV